MGDATSGRVRLAFNPQLRVEFRGATVTSDAGLLLPRELDQRLGLSGLIERHLTDPRTGHNYQFPLPDLVRQSIYSRLAGYEDTNDAERLAEDPTFRMLASRERRETSVALTSTLHWFETEVLAEERNYQGLARLNTDLVQHEAARPLARRLILDVDSSESPVHGAQEQAAYNGHFESVCYHPLFAFNQNGDCLAAALRPGNVHSGDGWEKILLPLVERSQARRQTVVVRAVHFYNQRGTAEQWIKEGKEATHWTRLSRHGFRANEVRLLLGVIAYNLGNLLRRLVLPLAIQSWSLTSLQQRLFKTGGRLIRHPRYFILQLAESHLTRHMFGQILGRIERLAWHPT
jgi:DDE family transposase